MNPEKHYDHFHSETTTEEETEETAASRFYECNFCKRGFTNAQALGGHMNIHRKEKTKTKPKVKRGTVVSNKSRDDDGYGYGGVINPGYYSTYNSSDIQERYYAVPQQQMNYQYYYPSANPGIRPVAYHHLSIYEDHRVSNLSLRVEEGGAHHEVVAGGSWTENEIDLELHL